ncbi:MAG: clan AA aspartic protease [Algoriphagus sp.]|uniref:retropepsin-like aspartic protease n=1 Tax=Algoriphagus sp. TaxID=1872435 RepID=UPI0017B0DB7F|nr:retropepsin-like aspartic protease [Algoriphagus sp.]NVJ85063.1 clan AA aspartic protease [Algoriphagus sp.]
MKKILLPIFLSIFLSNCTEKPKESSFSYHPKQLSSLSEYLLESGYSQIQMEKEKSGHLHLKGKINGVEANFILDTGAGLTIIETKRKNKFKMKSNAAESTGTGAGGANLRIENSKNNTIEIGNIKLENYQLALMTLNHVNTAFTSLGIKETDGIIGADILSDQEAIIDYTNLILYLKNSK